MYSDLLQKIDSVLERQDQILNLVKRSASYPEDPYIPLGEFQSRTGIGRWVFDRLRREGKLRVSIRSRQVYVHHEDVTRYLNGQIE